MGKLEGLSESRAAKSMSKDNSNSQRITKSELLC